MLKICSFLAAFHLTVWIDHDELKGILSLTDPTSKLARWQLQLKEFKFDVLHCAGINHQAAEALSPLKTTRTDQTSIEDELPVLFITSFIFTGKEIREYIQDYEVLNDKKSIELSALQFIGTSAKTEYDKRPILHRSSYKSQWRIHIDAKGDLQSDCPAWCLTRTEMGYWFVLHPSIWQNIKSPLCH